MSSQSEQEGKSERNTSHPRLDPNLRSNMSSARYVAESYVDGRCRRAGLNSRVDDGTAGSKVNYGDKWRDTEGEALLLRHNRCVLLVGR
jgi:hypothetical protein